MNSILHFWRWFEEHQEHYYRLADENRSLLLDLLLNRLQDIHHELYIEINPPTAERAAQFIITVEGDISQFEKVEEVVMQAPQIHNWEIIAFKPGEGFDLKLDFKGLKFNPHNLWFFPIEHPQTVEQIGILVGTPVYDTDKHVDLLWATELLLQSCLGEKSAAMPIDYINAIPLPDQPADYLQPFTQIQEYIEARRQCRL